MILEVAILNVKPGMESDFERDFHSAGKIIASSRGYVNHSLHKCIEDNLKYILLVHWETVEDHTLGFRQSPAYQEWKRLLHHYYSPFPVVEHYNQII